MAFNVIDVETGTLVRFQRKQGIAQFDTTARATAYAKRKSVKDGKKYKIRAATLDDTAWIAREQRRMDDGTYVKVPFTSYAWYRAGLGTYTKEQLEYSYGKNTPCVALIGTTKHHFPHVSMSNKTMLAYTESSEKGARDIQTQIKPGAYLAKFFGSVLSPGEITDFVNDWKRRYQECTLKFARTPAGIVHIYQNSPRSCMSGEAQEYHGRTADGEYHHPCEVYGLPHSDLTLAYLEGKNGVMSRCLVWEAKKEYGRIYGDPNLITRELHALGFKQTCFLGAKLGKILLDKRVYLMPYVDSWSRVLECPDHFLLATEAPKPAAGEKPAKAWWFCCGNTHGNTHGNTGDYNEQYYTCVECDDEVSADDVLRVPGHGYYCRSCYEANYIYCGMLGRYLPREGSEEVCTSFRYGQWLHQTWSAEAIAQHAFRCPIDGALYANAHKVQHDGQTISRRAYEAMVAERAPPAPQTITGPFGSVRSF